ncbi:MAG: 4Fe-4S binding protein [Bacillota bacterium]|nr:4Fe-4S binding protein [Bacillota bacterium]
MPNSIAIINYKKCHPDQCPDGICAAALACPLKILVQEDPYDIPFANPSPCKGCSRCANACPLKAINLSG